MLKEIYVISDGLNLFYYSSETKDDTYVKSNLTSGLLSAIQSFSLEARDSEVESFVSKDEYFYFSPLSGKNKLLICVYDKQTNAKMADILLKQIKSIVVDSHIIKDNFSNIVNIQQNRDLSQKIEDEIKNLFNTSYPSSLADDIFTNSNISLLRVLDVSSGEVYYENARPKQLLKKDQITELKLFLATIDKLADRFKLPHMELTIIGCEGADFGIIRNQSTVGITFASGIIDPQMVTAKTLEIMSYASPENYFNSFHLNSPSTVFEINDSGQLLNLSGEAIPSKMEVFFLTVINAIERNIAKYIRKPFSEVKLYFSDEKSTHIAIDKDTNYIVRIFR